MTALQENLERLEEAIARACHESGRPRDEVELMAVSKTYPAETIAAAAELGLRLFGENRVQEFAAKAVELEGSRRSYRQNAQTQTRVSSAAAENPGFVSGHDFTRAANELDSPGPLAPEAAGAGPIRIHLIGHLQSNKAARAAELFDAVDSVDSVRLAERLNEAAAKLGKRLPILVEVKLSTEETKAGLDPDSGDAARLLERLPDLEHLHAQGLMTIAPWAWLKM